MHCVRRLSSVSLLPRRNIDNIAAFVLSKGNLSTSLPWRFRGSTSGRFFLATDLDGVVRVGSSSTIRISATGNDFGGGSSVEPNREFMVGTFLSNWSLSYGLLIFLTFTLFF